MTKPLSEMTLEELWRLFPVILSAYNPDWQNWYRDESELLTRCFGDRLKRIRHIGSTSVPGMLAKPTVDILLEAAPDCPPEKLRESGLRSGYMVMAETGGNAETYRLDLCKGYTASGFAERVFHLHVRYLGDWDEPYFCEYLRHHPEVCREYAELKASLLPRFRHDRDGYTAAKGEFIRRWTCRARAELAQF